MEIHAKWLPVNMAFKIKDINYFPKSLFSDNIQTKWKILKVQKNKNTLHTNFCCLFESLYSLFLPALHQPSRFFQHFASLVKIKNKLETEQCCKNLQLPFQLQSK